MYRYGKIGVKSTLIILLILKTCHKMGAIFSIYGIEYIYKTLKYMYNPQLCLYSFILVNIYSAQVNK